MEQKRMKYPIGIETFPDIINGGYVYVDKTDLVYKMADEGKVYFLSRPRRFGKSLLISTLENYFLGKRELFKGLKIEALEKDWIEYPVFTLSFAKSEYTIEGALESALNTFISAAEEKYGKNPLATTYSDRFYSVLESAHEKTGRQVVVLIDEYDKPLLDVMDLDLHTTDKNGNRILLEEYNRNVLKGFYGVFKAADRHLKFVMLTGVTKFSQISVFSGFNQPRDISMDRCYETVCGISKDELVTVFDEPIHQLAEDNDVTYGEMLQKLKKKYDGYHFGRKMIDIFNPFSLINCFASMELKSFWFASGTPTYLVRLLAHCDENINELAGRYYDASQFVNYKANVQKPLPMIYQSGYLTIKDYDRDMNIYKLDFPNEEVRSGFIDALASDYFKGTSNLVPRSWLIDVTSCLRSGDVTTFMKKMTALLSTSTYRFQQKKDAEQCERFYQYTFYLIMQMINIYNVCVEKETSEGRIDCVIECSKYVYIIEFKLNGSAEEALKQIKDKGYEKPYMADGRQIISLGVNFSSEKGTVESYVVG